MSKRSLRIAFAGTPDLAATALQKILTESTTSVELVITQPDRPAGRGRKLKPSPVKLIAEEKQIRIKQPSNSAELDCDELLSAMDVMVVAAFGMLIPEAILNRPKYGCLNIHTSILPRWRGAAPIQRAIEAGDSETGVTIMQMEKGLDTGPMLLQKRCRIEADETAGSLHDKLAELGALAIVETLEKLNNAPLSGEPQDESLSSYAKKIFKTEAEIDWLQPAIVIERKIRAFNPMPVCYSTINGIKMRIWQAQVGTASHSSKPGTPIAAHPDGIEIACSEGSIVISQIQLAGKKPVSAREFINGHPDFFHTI